MVSTENWVLKNLSLMHLEDKLENFLKKITLPFATRHRFPSFFLYEHTCGSGELGVMTASLRGASLRHAQPCYIPKALLSAVCLHYRHWFPVFVCVCMGGCVRVCVCSSVWVHPAAEQDPIWFAPLACEARLRGSTSLYSSNGFPSPLLLTLPQTAVMCTLVNIL